MSTLSNQSRIPAYRYLANNPSYQGINISKIIKQVSIIRASCEKQADTTRVHRTGLHASKVQGLPELIMKGDGSHYLLGVLDTRFDNSNMITQRK
ncbi:hypothetical protein Tco_0716221 [Tanacetum coccineum]